MMQHVIQPNLISLKSASLFSVHSKDDDSVVLYSECLWWSLGHMADQWTVYKKIGESAGEELCDALEF